MPISLPYEQITERAFALIDEGNSLDGAYALYEASVIGSYQAYLVFANHASINVGQFRPMTGDLASVANDNLTQFKLALCYLTGIGVRHSLEKAHAIFANLSSMGVNEAKTLLGWMYDYNLTGLTLSATERDEKAVELYFQAAQSGDSLAKNNLAFMYYENRAGFDLNQVQRDKKAMKLFTQAAVAGNTHAQANLALMYNENRAGLEFSSAERAEKAVELYFQAAQAGNVRAKFSLAIIYDYDRTGSERNKVQRDEKAEELYSQAAQAGDAVAKNNLGFMYYDNRAGLGLSQEQRDEKAQELFKQAIQAKDEEAASAKTNLAVMYKENRAGLALSIKERIQVAIDLLQESAKSGSANAARHLAGIYKSENNNLLAIKFLSFAASLQTMPAEIENDRSDINAFADCLAKDYALARINTFVYKNLSLQYYLLNQFAKPSEYLPFYDCDIVLFKMYPDLQGVLYQRIEAFLKSCMDYDALEKIALTQLVIAYIETLLLDEKIASAAILSTNLETLATLIDLVNQHELQYYLPIIKDKTTQNALVNITTTLLAIHLMEPCENRAHALKFIALIAHLPESTEIFRQDNLHRLCCTLITQGRFTLSQITTPLSPSQLKALVMHIAKLPIIAPQGLDDDAVVDEIGIRLMGTYGFKFLDDNLIRQQAQALLISIAPATPIAALQPLHQQNSPRFHPWLRKVEDITKAQQSYEMVISLLQLHHMIQTSYCDNDQALFNRLSEFLIECGIHSAKSLQLIEESDRIMDCAMH